ncbi:hypothetical protein AMECASPLE_012641 [Ameca splendens]|uniref:Ig-like domain-containing protein n=1 Tax=Ameca splendens TaxID=208324 RepID=A0ABV0XPZ7_9TELE
MAEVFLFEFLVIQTFIWPCTGGDPKVTCVYSQSCILPCNVHTSSDSVILWNHITSEDSVVHSYYNGQDQLGHQNQQFKGRTSLFKDLISRGNASLKLTGVKVQDEGRYRCYSSTVKGFQKSFIELRVEAPVKEVDIKQVENRIICSSEGIYPKPQLTWSINPRSKIEIHTPTTVQQTQEQLYSISSSLLDSDSPDDLIYSCTVSSGRNSKRATFYRSYLHDSTTKQGKLEPLLSVCLYDA